MGFRRGKIDHGEMAEWSIAAVLKTVELRGSGGSNPSLSAEKERVQIASDLHPFAIYLLLTLPFEDARDKQPYTR